MKLNNISNSITSSDFLEFTVKKCPPTFVLCASKSLEFYASMLTIHFSVKILSSTKYLIHNHSYCDPLIADE